MNFTFGHPMNPLPSRTSDPLAMQGLQNENCLHTYGVTAHYAAMLTSEQLSKLADAQTKHLERKNNTTAYGSIAVMEQYIYKALSHEI